MKSAPNDLTVLVFKENSVARTFRVPIQWISRLGLIAGITAAIAVLGLFLSAKFYNVARQASRASDPAYLQDLEKEVGTLRSELKASESKMATSASTVNNPTPTHTSASSENSAQVSHGQVGQSSLAFSALPANVEAPPATADNPIIIYDPRVNWYGRTLKVQFFIQYTKEDKGNQQGRIVVLARGPETLLAYPAGILNATDSSSLIAPDKGEYFSVSHIREVKTDFGPMKSNTALKEIEIFLFGNNDRLLVHQVLTPGPVSTSANYTSPKSANTSPTQHSTLTEPSVNTTADKTPNATKPNEAPTGSAHQTPVIRPATSVPGNHSSVIDPLVTPPATTSPQQTDPVSAFPTEKPKE